MTEVDYGAATPEMITADRFGVRQEYELRIPGHQTQHFIPFNQFGVFQRLGLRVLGAWKSFGGLRDYRLEIDERVLHVRTYSDGRLKITLDGEDVYTEKVRVKTVRGVKHRVIERRHVGDAEQDWARQMLHAEAIIENVRWDLDRRKQKINSQKE